MSQRCDDLETDVERMSQSSCLGAETARLRGVTRQKTCVKSQRAAEFVYERGDTAFVT